MSEDEESEYINSEDIDYFVIKKILLIHFNAESADAGNKQRSLTGMVFYAQSWSITLFS